MKTYTVQTAIYVRVEVEAESAQAAVDSVYDILDTKYDTDHEISSDPLVFDEEGNEVDLEEEEV